MMPRHGATPAAGPRRRTARWGGVLVAVLALNACGLPVTEDARVVEAEAVPYDLLEPHQPVSGEDEAPTTPRGVPVVFWIRPDGRLTPAAAELACDQPTADVAQQLLLTLVASPTDTQRDAGLASAIPASARFQVVALSAGTAEVEVESLEVGDAERLPLAVGQIVLTLTSAPGVDSVRLTTSGQTLDLPLPDGKLVSGPTTDDDYATLLPARLALDARERAGLGCPDPVP